MPSRGHEPAEALRRIAERALAGEPVDASDAEWLADVVAAYVTHAPNGLTLDRAAGLAPEPGREPWWRAQRRETRDQALREMARRYYADLSCNECATTIQAQIVRYEATAWLIDRRTREMPSRYVGTPKACLFRAFATGLPVPRGLRQLRTILSPDAEVGNQLADFTANDCWQAPRIESEG